MPETAVLLATYWLPPGPKNKTLDLTEAAARRKGIDERTGIAVVAQDAVAAAWHVQVAAWPKGQCCRLAQSGPTGLETAQ